MKSLTGGGVLPRIGRAVIALYCVTVFSGGFFHHDFACHLKSPTHCTTCAYSLSSAGVQAAGGVRPVVLQKTGQSFHDRWLAPAAPVVVRIADRSPPA